MNLVLVSCWMNEAPLIPDDGALQRQRRMHKVGLAAAGLLG